MGVESEVEAMDNAQERLCHGRMYYAHPTLGECYYLRMLLNYVKGATSYEHLRTMDDALPSPGVNPLEGSPM
jgi:hypothetical protein